MEEDSNFGRIAQYPLCENYVITGLKNGIGNIVVEIMVGLLLAHELTKNTGISYGYYGYILPSVMYGHKTEYNGEHQIAKIPLKIHKIFPYVAMIDALPSNIHHIHYLTKTDITNLEKYKTLYIDVDCIGNIIESFNDDMLRADIIKRVKFNPRIENYINNKYSIKNNETIGVHIRLLQPGDYVVTKYPSATWYGRAVSKLLNSERLKKCYLNTAFHIWKSVTIFIVCGIDSSQKNEYFCDAVDSIKFEVSSVLGVDIKIVSHEPYCVDMCLLSMCDNLIITNSTLSLTAGLFTNVAQVIYPNCLANEINKGELLKFSSFVELKDENFVTHI
jgi:hypothetical protein